MFQTDHVERKQMMIHIKGIWWGLELKARQRSPGFRPYEIRKKRKRKRHPLPFSHARNAPTCTMVKMEVEVSSSLYKLKKKLLLVIFLLWRSRADLRLCFHSGLWPGMFLAVLTAFVDDCQFQKQQETANDDPPPLGFEVNSQIKATIFLRGIRCKKAWSNFCSFKASHKSWQTWLKLHTGLQRGLWTKSDILNSTSA